MNTIYCPNLNWYNKVIGPDDIYLIINDGILIRWVYFAGKRFLRLEIFDDQWEAFSKMPDLIETLAEIGDKKYTQKQIIDYFVNLGYHDITMYVHPGEEKDESMHYI